MTDAARTCCLALVLGLALLACEESVDPVLETERPYTLYGYLNPLADTQAVRVFDIEGTLEPSPGLPLNAQVVSTRERDTPVAWRDSVVSYRNGTFGNVYWAPFRADFETTYRIEATDAVGETASVTVRTPPEVMPVIEDPIAIPGFVESPVRWPDAPRLLDIVVTYKIQIVLPNGSGGERFDIRVDYDGTQERIENGWVVTVDLFKDIEEIVAFLFSQRFNFRAIALEEIEMALLVTSEEWFPPGGEFDAEVLVEPGTFSNVDNGFGFVGGGYPAKANWLPPEDVIRQAGFVPVPDDADGG